MDLRLFLKCTVGLMVLLAISLPNRSDGQGRTVSLLICGREIKIRETRSNVLRELSQGNCSLVPVGEEQSSDNGTYVVSTKESQAQGTVTFSGAKVVAIEKNWNAGLSSASSYGEALIRLLQKLQGEGFKNCVLSSRNLSDANIDYRTEIIDCGSKQVRLGVGMIGGSKSLDIDEVLNSK